MCLHKIEGHGLGSVKHEVHIKENEMSDQVFSPTLWLDVLPDEVCESIASYATNGQLKSSALNLANTSSKQHRAVLNVLPQPLHLNFQNYFSSRCDEEQLATFPVAFPNTDIHLSFERFSPVVANVLRTARVTKCATHGKYVPWLRGPIWCKTICGIVFSNEQPPNFYKATRLFEAVLAKDTIRSLTMEMATEINITKTFCELSKMNLEELHLHGRLLIGSMDELAIACNQILTKCPSLRLISMVKLDLSVSDDGSIEEEDFELFRTAVEKFPKCCVLQLMLLAYSPKYLMNRLNEFRGLDLNGLASAQAAQFAAGLQCLRFTANELNGDDLEALGRCPNLEEIDICFKTGMRLYLRDLLRQCKSVKTLKITEEDEIDDVKGVLLNIAREGHKVTDLALGATLFGVEEWRAALKVFGRRLERLSICFGDHFDKGRFNKKVDVLEAILGSFLEYNRGLKYFVFTNIVCPEELGSHGEVRMKDITRLLDRVRDVIPLLNEGIRGNLFEYHIGGDNRAIGYSFDCRSHYCSTSISNDYLSVCEGICPWPGRRDV